MNDVEVRRRVAAFDLLHSPGHLLRRNHQRSFDIFSEHVGEDVTRQQIALLIALMQRGESSQRALVDATGIDKSTIKEVLTRMIARGWVSRQRDPIDSRAWRLSIAPPGLALVAARLDALERAQRAILEPLSETERAAFVGCLRKLVGLSGNAAIDADRPSTPRSGTD